MRKLFNGAGPFVGLYLLAMFPTYVLPYVGSNSSLMNAAALASGIGMNPAFWLHLLASSMLVFFAFLRGRAIERSWLPLFPFLALVFDLVPGSNWVPLVPTICHLKTISFGVILTKPIALSAPNVQMSKNV